MSKRKRFGIAADIDQGLTDVINAVNNNTGNFRYDVVALSRIEPDPDNPRELMISPEDLRQGLQETDPHYKTKKQEKAELESIARTIKTNGVLNPVVIYKNLDKYRLVAGERRLLASILAEKQDIHARILPDKPNFLTLRQLQWIENIERKDLSLRERLRNLQAIVEAYMKEQGREIISIDLIMQLTGISKTQASLYLSLLNGPKDLLKQININAINNLEKASFLASVTHPFIRGTLIQNCIQGSSLKELKKIAADQKQQLKMSKQVKSDQNKKRGRAAQSVNLGKTKNIELIRKLSDIVLSVPKYQKHVEEFKQANWEKYESVSELFQKLLKIIAKE